MMKQIGALLAGFFFAANANAFSIYSGDVKAEFVVGSSVGKPILRVIDTFYETSIANYNCNWDVAIAAEKSVGNLDCLSYASTSEWENNESMKVVAQFDLDTMASAKIDFTYVGDTLLAEQAAILRSLSGTHEVKDVGPNSIVHSMRAIKEAVSGFVGQTMISKILSAEMGVDVIRPIQTVRLDVHNGVINATVDLKYNTAEFNSSVFLGGVLNIRDQTSVDAEALKTGIADAITLYNETNAKK